MNPFLSKFLRFTRKRMVSQTAAQLQRALKTPLPDWRAWKPEAPEVEIERAPVPGFHKGSFSTDSGTRPYKLFVPAGFRRALPLVVMLHGCTQDPDDFAAGTRMNDEAERRGFLVLYPQQGPRSNAAKCWNWFRPADQRRGAGEPALIAGMARHIIETHAVDSRRVYAAGLSAGAAMAVILGREYPDLFAAIGVHSGLPQGAAHDVASAFAAMKHGAANPREIAGERAAATIVFHGDADPTVHPRNGQLVIDALLPAEARARSETQAATEGGRRFTRTNFRDAQGRPRAELWEVHGAGHAWSGGSADGTYTDPAGPDATREMLRFFEAHPRNG